MDRILRLLQHPLLRVWFADKSKSLWSAAAIAGCIVAIWQLRGRGWAQRLAEPREESRSGTDQDKRRPSEGEHHNTHKTRQANQSLLRSAHLVTICAMGVLLRETKPDQMEESATFRHETLEPLLQLLQGGVRIVVIAQVKSAVGETAVEAAMEEAGLIGFNSNQLPPHRLLKCFTKGGKESMVRQLEPDVHLEADLQDALDVKRFVKKVVLLDSSDEQPSSAVSSPLLRVRSIMEAFD